MIGPAAGIGENGHAFAVVPAGLAGETSPESAMPMPHQERTEEKKDRSFRYWWLWVASYGLSYVAFLFAHVLSWFRKGNDTETPYDYFRNVVIGEHIFGIVIFLFVFSCLLPLFMLMLFPDPTNRSDWPVTRCRRPFPQTGQSHSSFFTIIKAISIVAMISLLTFAFPLTPLFIVMYIQHPIPVYTPAYLLAALWAYFLYLFAFPDPKHMAAKFKWPLWSFYFVILAAVIVDRLLFWISFMVLYKSLLKPFVASFITYLSIAPYQIGIGLRVPPHLTGGQIELVLRLLFTAAFALAAFVPGVLAGIVVGWPLACALLPEASARRILPFYPEGRRNTLIPLLLTLGAIAVLAVASLFMLH